MHKNCCTDGTLVLSMTAGNYYGYVTNSGDPGAGIIAFTVEATSRIVFEFLAPIGAPTVTLIEI